MKNWSAKNKIIVLALVWIGLIFGMFWRAFEVLDNQNQTTLDSMSRQRRDLAVLKAEKASYEMAKQDLDKLSQQQIQPGDLFSQDVTLVREIATLQNWADRLGVKVQLGGISGTAATASKAKTVTPLGVIPYSINISGEFNQVLRYFEVLENLSFVSNLGSMAMNKAESGSVNAGLTANFYIKK